MFSVAVENDTSLDLKLVTVSDTGVVKRTVFYQYVFV